MNCEITLGDILTNEALRQQAFQVTSHKIYLAHAAVCPLPSCVIRAVSDYMKQAARAGQFEYLHHEVETQTRCLAAELLGASPEEIAFVSSTSAGLSLVAAGLDWRVGDNVVIAEGDFPANIYPWLNLQRRGVQVKFIPCNRNGSVTLKDVASQVDHNTRLVSLSTVHFSTGTPVDLDTIGKFLHEHGILFCVDAIQSLGAMPCSVRYVDFLAADAHKWLLGPQGIGVLFVRRDHLDRLHPILVGWKTMRSPKEFLRVEFSPADSACRYEPGCLNVLGLVGLQAALSLLLKIGVNAISERLITLRSILILGLQERGYEVLGIPSQRSLTGITSFRHASKNITSIHQQLDDQHIVVSLRDDLSGNKCIRVSPHFYNTEAEINSLLANL